MIECGTVKQVKRDKAVVVFDRRSACDKCRMCAVSKGGMTVEITIKNTLNKSQGDLVYVEMGGKFVLAAAAIVYVIPLILVAAGLWLGTLWGEIAQIIAACCGLVLGFGIAVLLDRLLRKKKGFIPAMVEKDELDFSAPQAFLSGNAIDRNDTDVDDSVSAEASVHNDDGYASDGDNGLYGDRDNSDTDCENGSAGDENSTATDQN